MFLLIDNYDSFTYNLVHYFGELGEELLVYRNDSIKAEEAVNLKIKGIIISPGPCDPDRAGICLNLIKHAANRKLPVFGVCLGHQVIGQAFGNKIIKAPRPMHGKLSKIEHVGKGVFRGIPNQFVATRYHSLMLDPNNMPDCLEVLAKTNDGVVHVLYWSEFVEEATNYKANAYTVTRFMFDESGKVAWVGNLSEDRFVLEQQGWNISR